MAATWKPMVIPTPKQPFHQKNYFLILSQPTNPKSQKASKTDKKTQKKKKQFIIISL